MSSGIGPRDEAYDVVVVGGGIGGLTAGALLAKAGQKVLLAERQDAPGGYAHQFRRGPYIIDPAVHVTGQGGEGELFDSVLRQLGVRDRCTLLPVGAFYAAQFPDFTFHAPVGIEQYIEAHAREFPSYAGEIREFVRLCFQVNRQAHLLPPRLSLRELDEVVERYPLLVTYLKATLGEVMSERLSDHRVRAVLAALWPYVGLPPSRLSFLTYTQMMSSMIDGTYYCQGSFQNLIDALALGLERNGGELALSNGATRIVVEDGHVAGVELEDGRSIRATRVISNADARQTFERLVGTAHLPAPFVRRLLRMKPSLSACLLYSATRLDMRQLGAAHETFVYRHWDHDDTFSDIEAERPGGMFLSVPSLIDPSLAPPGEQIVILTTLAKYDIGTDWESAKAAYTDQLLDQLEVLFPGYRDAMVFAEVATPSTLEKFTANSQGAIYGWEYTPDQAGSKRLSHQTPIAGLYLAGHWTQPGAASLRVLLSGVHTAQIVLADAGQEATGPAFQAPDLPPAF